MHTVTLERNVFASMPAQATLGRLLKAEMQDYSDRMQRKVLQEEIAEKAGISRKHLSRVVNDKSGIDDETLGRLVQVLQIPTAERVQALYTAAFPLPPVYQHAPMLHIHDGKVDAYDSNGDGVVISQADYEWLQMAKRLAGLPPPPDKNISNE